VLRLTRADQSYVLRHPPEHKRANSDETMRREARVLTALANSDVPHAHIVAACGDIDVLGSAFYLMELVDGANPTVELPSPYIADKRWRRELAFAMADGAAAIGAVDYVSLGLSNLGKADGFLERQVARWRSQLDSYADLVGYAGPEIPAVDQVGRWLDANRPRSWQPGLIHGDYHLANVLCRRDRPGLAAIIDWELTTIGDSLLDLGWLLATWPGPDGPGPGTVGAQPWDGFATAEELVIRYGERSDRDLSAIPWYLVLACYKLGIILEGTYARACAGQASPEVGDRLHAKTLSLFERACAAIASA